MEKFNACSFREKNTFSNDIQINKQYPLFGQQVLDNLSVRQVFTTGSDGRLGLNKTVHAINASFLNPKLKYLAFLSHFTSWICLNGKYPVKLILLI